MDQKGSATNHFNQSPPGYIRHDQIFENVSK